MPEETLQEKALRQRRGSHCFLCGKTREELRKLILGKTGGICFECVGLCVEIIRLDAETPTSEAEGGLGPATTTGGAISGGNDSDQGRTAAV